MRVPSQHARSLPGLIKRSPNFSIATTMVFPKSLKSRSTGSEHVHMCIYLRMEARVCALCVFVSVAHGCMRE